MDKQTAIDLLDNLLGMVEDNHESDYDAALHMGIDALKSNASNALSALDCIDRQAALNCFHDWVDRRGDVHTPDEMAEYRALEALPSVQQCDTCRYVGLEWDEEPCDSCTRGGETNHYKPSVQPEIIRCEECRWGREVCGNIECFVDSNLPPEYHGYEWFCPNGERRTDE